VNIILLHLINQSAYFIYGDGVQVMIFLLVIISSVCLLCYKDTCKAGIQQRIAPFN